MVGEASSHRRGARNPTPLVRRDPKWQAQAMVWGTEVVNRAQHHHAVMKRRLSVSQMTCATCKAGEPLSKGGVKSLNVGGIDDAPAA